MIRHFAAFLLAALFLSVETNGIELKKDNSSIERWKTLADSLKTSLPDSSFKLARQIYDLGNPADRAYAKYLAGYYYYKKQRYDTAYILLAPVADSLGESREKGTTLLHIGRIFSRQSNFKYAEQYHKEALAVFRKVGNAEDIVSTINGLGIAKYNQGNYTDALNYYSEAKSLAIDSGLNDQIVRLINNIVGVYTQLNQYDKAMEFAEEAYQISLKSSDVVDRKTAAKAKGYVFGKMGMIDSAIYYNELVVEFAKETGDTFTQHLPYFEKGDLLRIKKDLKGALTQYKKAVSILENQDYDHYVDQIKLQISDIYLEMNRPDSAIHFAEEAYAFAKKNNIKWSIQKSSFLLGQLYANQNPKKSIDYLQVSLAYKDSTYNEKSEQDFANQRVKLETIEKSKEILQLQSDAEIARLKRASLIRSGILSFLALAGILVSLLLYFLNKSRIQKLKEAALERELERNKRDLHIQTMNMIRLSNDLQEMEENLKVIRKKHGGDDRDVQRLLAKLQLSKSLEKEWESFNISFSNIHQDFVIKLKQLNAELTVNEIRLCELLKLNLTNSEISSILNIESKSVRMSKYRLKKRLHLEEEADISSFLQTI